MVKSNPPIKRSKLPLGRLRDQRAAGALVDTIEDIRFSLGRDALTEHQESQLRGLQYEAARALRRIGGEVALDYFGRLVASWEHSMIDNGTALWEAASALSLTRGSRVAGYFIAVCDNDEHIGDFAARWSAIKILGRMKCEAAVDSLADVVRDNHESPDTRLEAVKSLRRIGGENAMRALRQISTDWYGGRETRAVAASAERALNYLEMCARRRTRKAAKPRPKTAVELSLFPDAAVRTSETNKGHGIPGTQYRSRVRAR